MQDENGCGLVISKDEVSTDEISNAISTRTNDGFDEENDNFVARVERKLDAIERKLDGVQQIRHKLISWFFIFCCLFEAYMARRKGKKSSRIHLQVFFCLVIQVSPSFFIHACATMAIRSIM